MPTDKKGPPLKRRGKVWYTYYNVNGKKKFIPLSPVKSVAREKAKEEHRVQRGRRFDHAHIDVSWDFLKEKYWDYAETKSEKKESTLREERRMLEMFEKTMNPLVPEDLAPDILAEYKKKRDALGRSAHTVNRELGFLKQIGNWAIAERFLLPQNYRSLRLLKRNQEEHPRYFTDAEKTAILDACWDLWETALVHVGLMTGFRREEIARLTWRDVDWDRRRIRVTAKDGWTPKDYENRSVPAPDRLLEVLRKWQKENGKEEYVFGRNGVRSTGPYLRQIFVLRLLKRGEIEDANFHTMRHTYATDLVHSGIDVYRVSKLMGHASVKTTEIYLHAKPQENDPVHSLVFGLK